MEFYLEHERVHFFLHVVERQLFLVHFSNECVEKCHSSLARSMSTLSNTILNDLETRKDSIVTR